MATLLQIALLLILIALVGIILGYFFGKLSCKREDNSTYVNKEGICEEELRDNTISAKQNSEDSLVDDANKDSNSAELGAGVAASAVALSSAGGESDNKTDANDEGSAASDVEQNSADSNSENESAVNDDTPSVADEKKDANGEGDATSDSAGVNEEDKNSQDETSKENSSINDATEINGDDVVSDEYKPVALLEARDGKADNLCRIKGVGAVIEGKLHNLGIFHFDQIAAWTEKEIAWVDKHLAFSGRIGRENWIEQAKLLASGEETEFSKRVDKGEVETSPSK